MRHGRSRSQQVAASTGWMGSPGRSGGDSSPSGGSSGVTEEGGGGGGSRSSNAQFVSFFSLSLCLLTLSRASLIGVGVTRRRAIACAVIVPFAGRQA